MSHRSKTDTKTNVYADTEAIQLRPLENAKVEKTSDDTTSFEHASNAEGGRMKRTKTYGNKKLSNPLAGRTIEDLRVQGEAYARRCGQSGLVRVFQQGALLAQDPSAFLLPSTAAYFDDEDKRVLNYERTNPLRSQFRTVAFMVLVGAVSAVVQGMDQSVINGAMIFFPKRLGIADVDTNPGLIWIHGIIVGAPYFSSSLISCWFTPLLNEKLRRRGTIFLSCFICCAAAIGQLFCKTWQHLLITRLILGLGIGPKSGTVPVFTAECAPKEIRGRLSMLWQTFTSFGILLGYVMSLIFLRIEGTPVYPDLNWRLMLFSTCIPAVIVMCLVFFTPETPAWYMRHGDDGEAFKAMRRLRETPLQAARDLFLAHCLVETEAEIDVVKASFLTKCKELYTVPRNRRAVVASQTLMFMQQFCGINVIAYFSSKIFEEAGWAQERALLLSLGFGVVSFLSSFPALITIDRCGRRPLLLTTFPVMGVLLFFIGGCFKISNADLRTALIVAGIFVFAAVYGAGEGPVPFTYSAEAFPLYVRDVGMTIATATNWFFNGILGLTWPAMANKMTTTGGFFFYAAFCLVGFFLVFLFVPETKGRSLEQLDQVFEIPTGQQMRYHLNSLEYYVRRYLLRNKDERAPVNPADRVPPMDEEQSVPGAVPEKILRNLAEKAPLSEDEQLVITDTVANVAVNTALPDDPPSRTT